MWGPPSQHFACHRVTQGSQGPGTQDRPGRMGAARGWIWLLPEGVSAAPGNSQVSCQSPWEDGSLGSLAVIPPPGDALGPPVPIHPRPGGLAGQGALTRSVGLAGPQTCKPPSDHPTCVYWEPAESRVLCWALGDQRSIPQPQAWPLGAWVLTGLPSHTRPPSSPADPPPLGTPPSEAGRTSLLPSPTSHSAPRVFP